MVIEGRSGSSGEQYRYGFNGQEEEKEITGNESHTSAEFWMYDSRLGRRWNVDPVVKYWESPYATFANNSLFMVDPLGANADWFENDKGEIRWFDSKEKELHTAPENEQSHSEVWKNIGELLTVVTTSYIDRGHDIPLGLLPSVAGDKFKTTVTIKGKYDDNGTHIGFSYTFEEVVGETYGVIDGAPASGTFRVPYKLGSDWHGGFDRHTEVGNVEKPGLWALGGSVVDVNQRMEFTIDGSGYLSIQIGHGTFPSVKIDIVNSVGIEYQYLEHSYILSHGDGDFMRFHRADGYHRQFQSIQANKEYAKTNRSFIRFTGYTAGNVELFGYPHFPVQNW
jgi:hypothetical protein